MFNFNTYTLNLYAQRYDKFEERIRLTYVNIAHSPRQIYLHDHQTTCKTATIATHCRSDCGSS